MRRIPARWPLSLVFVNVLGTISLCAAATLHSPSTSVPPAPTPKQSPQSGSSGFAGSPRRRDFLPQVVHVEAQSESADDLGPPVDGPPTEFRHGFGANAFEHHRDRHKGQEENYQVHNPSSPTLPPIHPFINASNLQDFTTSIVLPNGNVMHIEQDVEVVYREGTLVSSLEEKTLAEADEVGPKHTISIILATTAAPPAASVNKECIKVAPVTVTKTAYRKTSTTNPSNKAVTVNQTRVSTRTQTRKVTTYQAPPVKTVTRMATQVKPSKRPSPQPKTQKAGPAPSSTKMKPKTSPSPTKQPKPRPKPQPKPKPQLKPNPQPKPDPKPDPQPVKQEKTPPAPYHIEMVQQHNKFRKEYGAGPLAHNQEYVLKSQAWLKQCKMEHPEGLASNLYAVGSRSPDLVAHAKKAVNAWVNGPGEVEAYDPNNPQASHFTQVVWKSTTQSVVLLSNAISIFSTHSSGPLLELSRDADVN
ncbi:hypothetical protein P389DRAFT_5667 [Cystobasidium minutum MCA 4210]|uniref:uncharacterized protein n=1 Tax=Cystobasidium minutum MCA 4210 TaxID=1397322 RepID=UPI0034D0092F|eukprot:jgi/Rhomi1/5667/CE5666_539